MTHCTCGRTVAYEMFTSEEVVEYCEYCRTWISVGFDELPKGTWDLVDPIASKVHGADHVLRDWLRKLDCPIWKMEELVQEAELFLPSEDGYNYYEGIDDPMDRDPHPWEA